MTEFEYEQQKLDEILQKYIETLEDTKMYLNSLPKKFKGDPAVLYQQMAIYENKLRLMEKGKGKPYFARIDFKNESDDITEECYLGKVGIRDYDMNIITVDWRAPIASMYYDSSLGKTGYQAPEGFISGELLIKRQIDIENGILQNIQDVDTVSNDDMLKPYLGTTADHRLKNIVSTIQAEQNDIIREKINKNLIIQGVAGCGKTTIALHKIAYLVYNFLTKIKPDQYMVIGPNNFFLDYISGVLPDLDAQTVVQTTFEQFVLDYINEDLKVNSSEKQLMLQQETNVNLNYCKLKNSLKFKELIDKFLDEYEENIIPKNDFIVRGVNILSSKVLEEIYNSIDKNLFSSFESRIERTILLASAYLEKHPEIRSEIASKALTITPMTSRDFIQKELRNRFSQSLKQHLMKACKEPVSKLYKEFLSKIERYNDSTYNQLDEIKEIGLNNLSDGKIDFDDLASLSYLKLRINGAKDYEKYKHVVVDEAQDLGTFNFYVLKEINKKSTFSIFGDIAQSIYSYRSIDDWDSVIQIFNNNIEYRQLLKSYRTTIEIMNEANNITDHIGLDSATPVIRHGVNVNYELIDNINMFDKIYSSLKENIEMGHETIAIVCKNSLEALDIFQNLKSVGINPELVIDSNNNYKSGICVTTAYLAKGLEFDSVIITNASEITYSSANKNDMKLLYVAMTRALHKLDVLFDGEITKPLYESYKKKQINASLKLKKD